MVVSSLDQVVRSTHLPPLPLPVVALEQALVIWNSILAVDEARRRCSVSDCSCRRECPALPEVVIAPSNFGEAPEGERVGQTHPH